MTQSAGTAIISTYKDLMCRQPIDKITVVSAGLPCRTIRSQRGVPKMEMGWFL